MTTAPIAAYRVPGWTQWLTLVPILLGLVCALSAARLALVPTKYLLPAVWATIVVSAIAVRFAIAKTRIELSVNEAGLVVRDQSRVLEEIAFRDVTDVGWEEREIRPKTGKLLVSHHSGQLVFEVAAKQVEALRQCSVALRARLDDAGN